MEIALRVFSVASVLAPHVLKTQTCDGITEKLHAAIDSSNRHCRTVTIRRKKDVSVTGGSESSAAAGRQAFRVALEKFPDILPPLVTHVLKKEKAGSPSQRRKKEFLFRFAGVVKYIVMT
jgi:hypothetical protein